MSRFLCATLKGRLCVQLCYPAQLWMRKARLKDEGQEARVKAEAGSIPAPQDVGG